MTKNINEPVFELSDIEIAEAKHAIAATTLSRFTLKQLFGKKWPGPGEARDYGGRFVASYRNGAFPEIVEYGKKSNSMIYAKPS